MQTKIKSIVEEEKEAMKIRKTGKENDFEERPPRAVFCTKNIK